MKKFKTMMAMMLALVSMCVAFSSCSSDDDNDTVAAAKEIAGSYTSTLDMTVMGEASTYDNLTMKIEAVDDATVKVTLPACGTGMMALPALEVPAVKVSGSNGAYASSGKLCRYHYRKWCREEVYRYFAGYIQGQHSDRQLFRAVWQDAYADDW